MSPSLSPQIAASADDARQQLAPGTVELTEAYVQVLSWNSEALTDIGGLRFALDVPQGATILSAIITADILASPWDNPRLDIKAEQADDPGDFSGDDIVSRWPAGGPSVEWIAGELGAGSFALPDIVSVLQPIVERAGWAAGQHAVILLRGRGDFITGVRFTSWDGDPALAATLAVTFQTTNKPTWQTVQSKLMAMGYGANVVLGEPQSGVQSGTIALISIGGDVDEATLKHPREIHRLHLRMYQDWLAEPQEETEFLLDQFRADIKEDIFGDFDLGGTIGHVLPEEFTWDFDETTVQNTEYRIVNVHVAYRVDDRAAFVK